MRPKEVTDFLRCGGMNCDNSCERYPNQIGDCMTARVHDYVIDLEQRVPRWISVEERLPDKSHDWVLIIGKWESDGGWIVPRVAEYREGIWMTNGTGWNKIEDLHIKITHWMPLPELPEEGV